MKRCLVFCCLFFWLMPLQAADTAAQGSLFLGQTVPGNKIIYKDKPVMVTAEGEFVLGFGRDAKLEQKYQVMTPDGQRTVETLTLTDREFKTQRITGVAGKYVKPSDAHLRRVRGENELVWVAREHKTNSDDFIDGFIPPIDGPITGVYGSQRYFNGEPRQPHYGLDFAAPTGAPVVAPADGRVTLAHPDMFFSGGTMIIDHGMGVSSSFLHLSKLLVKEGQMVEQGQAVAEVGATGRVTGAHLDWRINWGQVRLDPALVLIDFPADLPGELPGELSEDAPAAGQ